MTGPGSENVDLVQNLQFAQTTGHTRGAEARDHLQRRSLVSLLYAESLAARCDAVQYRYYGHGRVQGVPAPQTLSRGRQP